MEMVGTKLEHSVPCLTFTLHIEDVCGLDDAQKRPTYFYVDQSSSESSCFLIVAHTQCCKLMVIALVAKC